MRVPLRFAGPLFSLVILASCSEVSDPSVLDSPTEGGVSLPGSADIFDGGSGAEGANPHFFFLSPVAPSTPAYGGVADDLLDPAVVVCPIETWDPGAEQCGVPLVTFTMDGTGDDELLLNPGSKYHVVWKTSVHPAVAGQVYRVAVSVFGKLLGYADIKAFTNSAYSGHHNTDPDYVAISDNGSLNITFRIEDGALESEYCDPDNLEDCDVEIFEYDEGGCLRVFENPGETTEILGSQACVPASSAEIEGQPVQGPYAVILTLEKDDVFQGGQNQDWQVPFFPDLKTDPPGISFDPASGGIDVVICQEAEGPDALDPDFHPFLRPFAIFSDGSIVLPEDFSFGVAECEGYEHDDNHVAYAPGQAGVRGVLSRVAGGLSRLGDFLKPQKLHAFRRLHGGLNTTVYNTRGDTEEGGGDNVAARGVVAPTPGDEFVVEFGAVLSVDPFTSTALVPDGLVGAETTVTVTALNVEEEEFPFKVPVQIVVSGSNTETVDATWLGGGVYQATYTPTAPGTDDIVVTVDGDALPGPYQSLVNPVAASAANTIFQVSTSEDGQPTTVTVTVLDGNGQPYLDGEGFPITVQISVAEGASGTVVATVVAQDDDGLGGFDGTYVASYTPDGYGSYIVSVTLNGEATGDSPQTITTAPRPADAGQSSVSVGDGLVDSPTTVSVLVQNTAGDIYDYGDIRSAAVEVTISGANSETFFAYDPDLDGTYEGSYTPAASGTDAVSATVDGVGVPGSYSSEVAPLSGDLVVVVAITGGAPSDGLPVQLYQAGNSVPFMTGTTDLSGEATFLDIDFGDYVVHLPKRDFDMTFQEMTQPIVHDEEDETVTFAAITEILPSLARVYRVKNGGTGNAFQYMVGGRSWNSANNQVQGDYLLGVGGHLATITDAQENTFVAEFFTVSPELCPDETNPKKCKYKGWIGLTDDAVEGVYQWVTGETVAFYAWPNNEEPLDRKGNLDHVEIGLAGTWGIVNGASSTNEGYFVEYEVEWPTSPPF